MSVFGNNLFLPFFVKIPIAALINKRYTRGASCRTINRLILPRSDILFSCADRQRPRTDRVPVQPHRLLREHQTASDVHAPVLVRREHDGRQEFSAVLRSRAAQAHQMRRGRSQPRRLLHPSRRTGNLHAAVFRCRTRFPVERGGQLRIVYRQRRPVFRRRYVCRRHVIYNSASRSYMTACV